jgi:hypothetical protein
MKKQPPKYSDHRETLVALVTYLAKCQNDDEVQKKRDDATLVELTKRLGLDRSEINTVLDQFKGLFRKSIEEHHTDKENDYRYALLLRYAQRTYVDDAPQPEWASPLSNQELMQLLSFIESQSREEEESKRQMRGNWITVIGIGITFLTSLVSLFVGLSK